jgi:Glutaredoxin-like domain (DUF836)
VRPVSAGSPPPGKGVRLSRYVLYSRGDCRLCAEMLAALRAQMGAGFPVEIVDVDSDPALKARYGEHVPVLMDGDTELFRHRYDPAKFSAYTTELR